MKRHDSSNSSLIPATDELARLIASNARSDGDYTTAVPGLSLHRRKEPTMPLHCIYDLGLGVIAQGEKQALVRDEVVTYGAGQSMLTSIELPVISQVIRATPEAPLLGLMLVLDGQGIVELATEMELPSSPRQVPYRPISVEALDGRLLADLVRLVALLEQPELLPVLAPLIKKEIVVRLLAGPHGAQLHHLVAEGSPSQQIAKAVAWLKQNFSRAVEMDELAAHVYMSPSTFRQHFRSVTGTSPLQYQKQLRLQQARQLMLNQSINAATASGMVGYESVSQFSREYSRLFGAPPQQDARRLRLAADAARG